MTITEQDKVVLIEFAMVSRKTYHPKLNPTYKKHKMTKVAGKWRQPRVLRELRHRTITFLTYLFSFKKIKNIKLKLGKGLAKHILKEFYQKQIKNRHVDHLFQEWFYTGVSQYILGYILQDRIRSLAIQYTMYFYTIVKKKKKENLSYH